MTEKEFYFPSSSGNARIHAICWLPEGEVCGVVQLVHGMSEYIARYRLLAEYLTGHGYVVAGHDHLGHGASAASDEELGYFAEENGSRCLVRDIHRLYRRMRREYPEVPYVMLGHSMGSFLTRLYLCCYGSSLDGAVLSGTGWHSTPELTAALALCRTETAAFGWHYRSRLFSWMTSGSYNQHFRPVRTEFDWLSSDEIVVDAYIADKWCGFPFTLNGYYNLFLTLYKIVRPEYLRRMPRSLPVLLLSGEEDPVGSCGKGVEKVEQLFRDTGMRNVTKILYPGERHEILNGSGRERVYEDLMGWMRKNRIKNVH